MNDKLRHSLRRQVLPQVLWLVAGAALWLANAPASGSVSAQKEPHPMTLSTRQQDRLRQALAAQHARYDAQEKMIASQLGGAYQYHTNLRAMKAHPTRDSLTYAVALLDTGDLELQRRAEEILRRVLVLQDMDPASPTFGIWGWHMEEPPQKMSPADFNWADFLGVQLLQIALDHRGRLAPELALQVDEAITRATKAIRKRNVGVGYTNIAIMGTYVTLVAAERSGDADLKDYALERLRRFHEYTRQQGAFTEYNSPTYTVVALKELARLRQDVQSPEAKPLIEELYRMAWEEIAHHFHAPTRQWAGPHSRAYSDLLGPDTLALIERSTQGRVHFGAGEPPPSLDEHRLPTPCPPDLEPFFLKLDAPRELVKTFIRKEKAPVIGTTHLAPTFALGSINRDNLWNQRRPLLAYWGTTAQPSFLRLRFLHDDYDFAATQFWGRQDKGRALAVLAFATDGGDKHISLDRIQNATIRAKDLRLRWELGGAAGEIAAPPTPETLAAPLHLRFGDLRLTLAVAYARFGDLPSYWEISKQGKSLCLDIVFYHGQEREFRLDQLQEAAIGLALQISNDDEAMAPLEARAAAGTLSLKWNDLHLAAPLKPAKAAALNEQVVF